MSSSVTKSDFSLSNLIPLVYDHIKISIIPTTMPIFEYLYPFSLTFHSNSLCLRTHLA